MGLSFSGITVLLSLTVFMLLVAEIMPATSDSVPLIGKSNHLSCQFLYLSNIQLKVYNLKHFTQNACHHNTCWFCHPKD